MKLKSADGFDVKVDLNHMAQHKSVLPLLEEIIPNMTMGDQKLIKTSVDMGRVVGVTDCVETTQYDEIRFATRKGRPGKTRFAVGRKRPECSHVTVIIKRIGDSFKLLTGFIGMAAEKEPFDPSIRTNEDYMKAKHFWDRHALVWGSQEVED